MFVRTKAIETQTTSETQYNTYREQITHKFRIIDDKLVFLVPHTRVKRGLINGLGSVVKAITGNLDNDDAVKIESELLNIRKQVVNVSNQQKKTVILAEKTISDFNKNLQTVVQNQKKLGAVLLNTTLGSRVVLTQLHFLDIYIQLDFSLQIILDNLMLLEDAITFSQLGIMHPSIISPQNLVHELLIMKNNFSLVPVIDINIDNIHEIERSIEVKAYSTAHTLTFILEIPSVASTAYDLIHIFSVPNSLNLTIIPESKFLILGSDGYAYLKTTCRQIADSIQLCKHLETNLIDGSKDCVINTLNQERTNCTYARMNLRKGKIQKLTPTSWLVVTIRDELLRSRCGKKTGYQRLFGTYIISLSEECQVQIMNTTLTSHTNTIVMHEVIPLPPAEQLLQPVNIQYDLKLEDIALDDLQQFVNEIADMKIDPEFEDWMPISFSPSWPTLLMYIFAVMVLIWKLWRWYTAKKPRIPVSKSADQGTSNPPGILRSCGARFYLKEGGVTKS